MCTTRFLAMLLVVNLAHFAVAETAPQPSSNAPIEITIEANKTGPEINPFIYGQFIEHLGRCIYGGIWAEMLEDRKFYYDITDEYRPYGDSPNAKFPIVSASPWQVIGPAKSVEMIEDDAFVGEHSPQIAAGSGIRQNDLGVVAGKEYDGYIWLRAASDKAKVANHIGRQVTAKINIGSATTTVDSDEFTRFAFSFNATRRFRPRTTQNRSNGGAMPDRRCFADARRQHSRHACRYAGASQSSCTAPSTVGPVATFVSGYNWRDGIGPRDHRPPRRNPAWTGVEHNDFGIDEFVRLCHSIGAEPMIAVNTGFGDDYSAAQEVEYANGIEDTIGGSWRTSSLVTTIPTT